MEGWDKIPPVSSGPHIFVLVVGEKSPDPCAPLWVPVLFSSVPVAGLLPCSLQGPAFP